VAPGRVVGEALDMLLEARIEEGPMTEDEAERRLLTWAAERGLPPAGKSNAP
jgi:poly(A) polymerase